MVRLHIGLQTKKPSPKRTVESTFPNQAVSGVCYVCAVCVFRSEATILDEQMLDWKSKVNRWTCSEVDVVTQHDLVQLRCR